MATLIGIAKTSKLLAEMEELAEAQIEIDSGLQGDARGTKRQRQISILFEDIWVYVDSCISGVNNLYFENKIQLYPNPAREGITINLPKNATFYLKMLKN